MKRKVPSEALECERLVAYLRARGLLFTHVPNENKSQTARIKNARLGTSAGFPDYAIFFPMGRALFIEMKRRKGGRLSKEQREWIDNLQARGHDAVVCAGYEDARQEVEKYL